MLSNRVLALSAAALVAASVASFTNAARATPVADGLAIANAAASDVETVRWYGGGFGWGLGAGLLGGAIIGGALAAPYYYGYGPYYPGYYGPPGPYYPGPYAAPPPGYGAPPPGYGGPPPQGVAGDPSAYCARKYKSYDPATGTFKGKDGARHPCP
jgi:hypothetical protein